MHDKILYVLDYYLPHCGGVETVFEQIITRTLAKWQKVIILTSQFDASLPKYEKDWNLEIYRVGSSRVSFFFHALIQGWQLLKKENIAFIHTSTYTGAIPAALLGRCFSRKVLLTVHEVFAQLRYRYKSRPAARCYHFFEWLIFQLPIDIFHCVSLYTLNSLRLIYAIPDHKLKLIHNGVDHSFRSPSLVSKEEKNLTSELFSLSGYRNLLYYGHTGISKGIDYLIQALPELLAQHADLQMIFNFIPAKRGAQILDKLNLILAQIPVEHACRVQIHYGMNKSELRSLVASVDAVVAPSLSEGFGSVHTEVCAMQIPLLTTNIAAIPEVVGDKTYLIPAASADAIIHGIQKIKNPDFPSRPSKHFDWQKQYEEIRALYQTFLS